MQAFVNFQKYGEYQAQNMYYAAEEVDIKEKQATQHVVFFEVVVVWQSSEQIIPDEVANQQHAYNDANNPDTHSHSLARSAYDDAHNHLQYNCDE